MRVSVLENYSPFRPAVVAGNKLLAAAASGDVRGPLVTFDRALAAVLDTVPNEEAAVFALTDAERIVEMIEKCADASGTPRDKVARAAMSLEAAYRRNLATMQRSDFAERLLRAPRAKAVLLSSSGGEAVMADAQAIKAANSAARREALLAQFRRAEERRARIEAEWREKEARLAAENAEKRRLIEAPIRAAEAIWRAGPSAPAAGAQLCADDRIHSYAGRRKDADWMMLIEAEIGRCARISDRTDRSYFMGLALGTAVTDEQLAHAAGRALMCLSTSYEKQLLDNMGQLTDQLFTSSIGRTGMRAQPVWSERAGARGRIVQVRCDLTLTLFGIDFHQVQQALAGGLEADASSFVEYELANGVLGAVRTHFVLSGTSRTENWSNDTTHYCDASLSRCGCGDAAERRLEAVRCPPLDLCDPERRADTRARRASEPGRGPLVHDAARRRSPRHLQYAIFGACPRRERQLRRRRGRSFRHAHPSACEARTGWDTDCVVVSGPPDLAGWRLSAFGDQTKRADVPKQCRAPAL
ncbi:hypothetical protein GGC65_003408 [Sphingopyxis sp. OAS728]|nr:hypothetical protein [Sphingopyxis sp. OAS728]